MVLKCSYCGETIIASEITFCPHCGAPLPVETKRVEEEPTVRRATPRPKGGAHCKKPNKKPLSQKTKIIIISLLGLFIISNIFSVFSGDSGEPKTTINPPLSASACEGELYEPVILRFENAGFTNIQTIPIRDLIVGWLTSDGEIEDITIGGNEYFRTDSEFEPDVPIVITYHTFNEIPSEVQTEDATGDNHEAETPVEETPTAEIPVVVEDNHEVETSQSTEPSIEVCFSKETAIKVVRVALTNCFAMDVFTSDGNNYDPDKFHNVDYLGSFAFLTKDVGESVAIDDHTWELENACFALSSGEKAYINCRVSFDGTDYIVSDISGTYCNTNLSDIEGRNVPYLVVSEALMSNTDTVDEEAVIQDDTATEEDTTNYYISTVPHMSQSDAENWIELCGEYMYPYGFKCHWILDYRASEFSEEAGVWCIIVGVTVENEYGNKIDGVLTAMIGGTVDDPNILAFDIVPT